MAQFHSLRVKEIRKETSDTVSVVFDIPNEATNEFSYDAGQYLALKFMIDGEDCRRSYSLSSTPKVDDEYRIAVKKVVNGKVSTYINEQLKEGDVVESMTPAGNFVLNPNISNSKHYIGFAAGSGITPVISILKAALKGEPNSKFTLVYGNKTANDTIYKSELDELQSSYSDRLNIIYVYSREDSKYSGRIDAALAQTIISENVSDTFAREYFLCGPEDMILSVSKMLEDSGTNKNDIHFELFTVPTAAAENITSASEGDFSGVAKVTVIMDDEETEIELASDGVNILDAAMDAGVDAPFSCKGAVCCTCKCQVTKGTAKMDMNYALSDAEVEEGFVLACQAHPTSEEVTVDFDVI